MPLELQDPPSEAPNDPTRRVTQEEQAGYSPEFGDQSNLFPNAAGNITTPTTGTEPPAKLPNVANQPQPSVLQRLQKRFSRAKKTAAAETPEGTSEGSPEQTKSTGAQAKAAVTDAAKSYLKKLVTQAVKKYLLTIASPVLIPVAGGLIVLGSVIMLVVGISIGRSLGHLGDRPLAQYNVNTGSVASSANPEGYYLKNMSSTYHIPNSGPLAMDATSGGVGKEDEAAIRGNQLCLTAVTTSCNSLAFAAKGKYNLTTKNTETFSADELKYYINMRWPYVHNVTWAGSFTTGTPEGYAEKKYYGGRRVIVWNRATNKAAVGIIADWGPGPWTGACKTETSDSSNDSNTRNTSTSCAEEKAAWASSSRQGIKANFSVPSNFTGRIIGLSPALMALVGAKEDTVVITGFANDQNLAPGTVFDPEKEGLIYKDTDLATGTSGTLNVPGVGQGNGLQCNITSYNMVALYYLSNKGQSEISYNNLPSRLKANLVPRGSNDESTIQFKTNPSISNSCALPTYLNSLGNGVPSDWTNPIAHTAADYQKIITSIKGGDPVIIYTYDLVYPPTTDSSGNSWGHVVVVSGYDETTGEFLINNPKYSASQKKSGADIHARGSNFSKPAFTISALLKTNGAGPGRPYGESMVIRKKYL